MIRIRSISKLGTAGFGILTLVGCAISEAPASKLGDVADIVQQSDRWSATKEGRSGVDRAWVERFKDDQLEQLVNEALVRNVDMRVAAENVKQAQQAARLAGASSRVRANAGLSNDRSRFNFIGLPFGGESITDTHALNLNVDWEPDIWGRVRAGVSASLADMQAVEQETRAAQASLVANLCRAWFRLCEANEQLELVNQAHGIRLKTLEAVRDRFELAIQDEGGVASELRLAETDVATSLADKAEMQGAVEAAKRQVELLVGRYPSAELNGHLNLPAIPSQPPAGLPSELLLRRPDILAAERRYASAGASMKEARLAVFPTLSLTGSAGSSTESLSSILDSQFGVWSIGSNVVQNILTGGRVKGEIERRSSVERQALAQLQSTVLNAFGEVESALATDKWLAKRVRETMKAQMLADAAAEATEEDFSMGHVDLATVFTAQNRKINITSQVTLLRRLQLENRVNLHLALGGAFKTQSRAK